MRNHHPCFRENYVQLSESDGAIQYLTADKRPFSWNKARPPLRRSSSRTKRTRSASSKNFKLTPDEGIYGLGQHQSGYMNYRGRTVKTGAGQHRGGHAVSDFHPGLGNSLGQLFQNHFLPTTRDHMSLWRVGDNLDYYFVCGKTWMTPLPRYRGFDRPGADVRQMGFTATGRARSNTRPAKSCWPCAEIPRAAIPFDGLVQDWNYWAATPTGAACFDET